MRHQQQTAAAHVKSRGSVMPFTTTKKTLLIIFRGLSDARFESPLSPKASMDPSVEHAALHRTGDICDSPDCAPLCSVALQSRLPPLSRLVDKKARAVRVDICFPEALCLRKLRNALTCARTLNTERGGDGVEKQSCPLFFCWSN